MKKTVRCTRCREEFTDEQIEGVMSCPACGTQSTPQEIAYDVQAEINWQDLRILCNWAERWAERCDEESPSGESVYLIRNIAKRLSRHRPEGAPALTLTMEVGELREEHPSAQLYDAKGRPTFPPEEADDA